MKLKAPKLYQDAHKKLINGSYADAVKEFDHLITQYPFSRYATQARLENIYAEYRSYKYDQAMSDAALFLRDHPRYPHADYALYLEGLINAQRVQSFTKHLGIEQSGHDPTYLRAAYQSLALLQRLYPKSRYRADARKRMIYLRNRIAKHELDITQFYISRGAWVAAARRATNIIANYPGAPATAKALLIMKQCYAKLGLANQEKQVDAIIAANPASMKAADIDVAQLDLANPPLPPSAIADSSESARSSTAAAAKPHPTLSTSIVPPPPAASTLAPASAASPTS